MIGIIGGSGLENPKILQGAKEIKIKTPYGFHSPIKKGTINGIEVALLSRHGYNHEYGPSVVPYRANIFALKELKCKAILATSACGSLNEDIEPATFSFPHQFIDRTTKREQSFTEEGKVIHESMAEPFSKVLRETLERRCKALGFKFSNNTTLVTIEGPRFSTKAESNLFRSWDCDLINMSTVPEVCLANEAKIPYQVINLVTDYDCWHENKVPVTFAEVKKVMKENAENVKKLLIEALPEVDKKF